MLNRRQRFVFRTSHEVISMKARIHINPKPKRITRFLDVHITDRCQLACKHCYLDAKNTRGDMGINMFKRLCHDFINQEHPVENVDIIMSGGEPLCHPQFPKFIKFLRSIGHGIRLSSNGILINEYIDLFDSRDGIQISIDGDEITHDSIRGEGVYNHASSALRLLNAMDINHSVTMALCKENMYCVDSVAKLCTETDTKTLNITLFQPHACTDLTPLSHAEWNFIRGRISSDYPHLVIPETCIQTGCIAGILGISVLPDGTYWDCSRNQEVIGRYPDPIAGCMYQSYIDNRLTRNQFETCCKSTLCVV